MKYYSINHPAVRAAMMMVKCHKKHKMMNEAVNQVSKKYPDIDQKTLEIMWIAINAKDRENIQE